MKNNFLVLAVCLIFAASAQAKVTRYLTGNAADVQYRSFLSRYKEFALEPGRNIIIRVSTDR